jgi:thiamine biosynthesis lipoprotein
VIDLLDTSFRALGAQIRLLIGDPGRQAKSRERLAEEARGFVAEFDARLSRFAPESELCALNADPRPVVPASGLLRQAVEAGLWAARQTQGLVDPTLLPEIELAGYRESREGAESASLREALMLAPQRRAARPRPTSAWREFEVDHQNGVIRRPPGASFDTGGTGKGLCADLVAERLEDCSRFCVDCGGDIRLGGASSAGELFDVHFAHPLLGRTTHVISVPPGGVATSGLDVRIWRRDDGRFAHHLLDPSTGQPAWTGLIGATAIGATALQAETLSKAALLSGAERARELLADRGGLIVHEDGEVEAVGRICLRPLVRVSVPADLVTPRAA